MVHSTVLFKVLGVSYIPIYSTDKFNRRVASASVGRKLFTSLHLPPAALTLLHELTPWPWRASPCLSWPRSSLSLSLLFQFVFSPLFLIPLRVDSIWRTFTHHEYRAHPRTLYTLLTDLFLSRKFMYWSNRVFIYYIVNEQEGRGDERGQKCASANPRTIPGTPGNPGCVGEPT